MNKESVGKFNFLFKREGPYIIVSDGKPYHLKIPEYGIDGNGNHGTDGKDIIDLTEDMVVYDPRKEFPSLVNLENPIEKAKLEACRREVDRDIALMERGFRKPLEFSDDGRLVTKTKTPPYKWGVVDDSITDIPPGKSHEWSMGKLVEQ